MTRPLVLLLVLGFLAASGCENRVSSTEQCLGSGGITSRFVGYTFDVGSGPALDVAGNCVVVLEGCTVRAPGGLRVREHGRVVMRGGALTGTEVAIDAADEAGVELHGVALTGAVRKRDAAVVTQTK